MNKNELRAVMARYGDTAGSLARYLGMTDGTLSNKINGETDFWRKEVLQIKERYNLTAEEVDNIFFAPAVSLQETNTKSETAIGNTEVTA